MRQIKPKEVKDISKTGDYTLTGVRAVNEERLQSRNKDLTTFKQFPHLSEGILTFTNQDDELYQMSIEQLEYAVTKFEKEIKQLVIEDCMDCAACSKDFLALENCFKIPALQYLEKLYIKMTDREINDEQLQSILQYVTSCKKLKELRFLYCSFKSGAKKFAEELLDRKVTVVWVSESVRPMKLHLQTGEWVEKDRKRHKPSDQFIELQNKFVE